MDQIVGIVNPTAHDFTCLHDSNADGHPISYTVKAREGIMLKRYIADHVSQKLCTQMLSDHKGVLSQETIDKTLKSIRLYESNS